ncbi:peptidoglycan-binding protein [Peribacillus asahii]|uniref:peptidoglycan-binding protein n=1 Tax=Peribacillus asahii TaxID=228899 RepID=UPI0037F79A36
MPVSLQTLLERSVKNMGSGIHPVIKESALEMIKRAYEEGIYVQISAGYRSMEEQAKLYGQGRLGYSYNGKNYSNMSKPKVTNAKPGQSYHNFGLAIDYFISSDDGRRGLWTVNDQWRRVAEIGKEWGFNWGGDWKHFKDYPHLEMAGGLSYFQLQSGKRPSLTSKVSGTYTPPERKVASEVIKKESLSKNNGDPIIKAIQKTLNSRYNAKLDIDGLNKTKMKTALIKGLQTELNKQFKAGLDVDGKWGTKTKAAVRNVRKGAKGNITYIVQAMLYIKDYNSKGVDGHFGDGTESAVRAFQRANRLDVDGIVGKTTFAKLFGS